MPIPPPRASRSRGWRRISPICRKPVELTYTHKKQSGGSGQFGEVKVKVIPGERGSGFQFFDEIKGGNVPREYIPSVEKGFRETAETGSLIGFPIKIGRASSRERVCQYV